MKKILLTTAAMLLSFNVYAKEAPKPEEITENGNLRLNVRRVALDVSSTEVKNSDQYQNSPVSELSANSETIIRGAVDVALEYEKTQYRWDQRLTMSYGRTKTRPINAPNVTNENADEILFTSEYTQKMWKYEDADVGPFGSLGYQTEFTENNGSPRQKIVRGRSGIRLFNGKYFSNLSIAAVGESDMTHNPQNEKLAGEIAAEAKYPLREGVEFKFEGYYRNYVSYSRYEPTDLEYDLNATGRMDVKLVGNLSLSPFVSYRLAEARGADSAGSNFTTGISLTYSDLFDIFK